MVRSARCFWQPRTRQMSTAWSCLAATPTSQRCATVACRRLLASVAARALRRDCQRRALQCIEAGAVRHHQTAPVGVPRRNACAERLDASPHLAGDVVRSQDDIDAFEATRDVEGTWSKRMKATHYPVYGAEGLQRLWGSAVDAWAGIFQQRDGDVRCMAPPDALALCALLRACGTHGTRDLRGKGWVGPMVPRVIVVVHTSLGGGRTHLPIALAPSSPTRHRSPPGGRGQPHVFDRERRPKAWPSTRCAAPAGSPPHRAQVCMGEAKSITCPTLVLHGAKDPICLSEHPEWFRANIPGDGNTQLHVLPEGKHNLHIRFADEVNALVRDFVAAAK